MSADVGLSEIARGAIAAIRPAADAQRPGASRFSRAFLGFHPPLILPGLFLALLIRAGRGPASIPGSIHTKQSQTSTRRETAHDRFDRRIHP
jgi:hypothetical protein